MRGSDRCFPHAFPRLATTSALAFAIAVAASACTPTVQPTATATFFPPPPALPRIQYLTSFTGVKDVEEQSAFNRFVVGEAPDVVVDKPYGVAMANGKIYVCDTNATVVVFDVAAKQLRPLHGANGSGVLRQPVNVSIADDGTIYVADPVRGQVVAYDANEEYVVAYGAPGAWRPVDAVAYGTRLYVADIAHGEIVVFDRASGTQLRSLGAKGDPSERLDRPTNLAFDRDGYLYVTDVGRFQVVKLDRDGHFQMAFGRPGDGPGHFARPKGIAVDHEGRLYAVDAAFNNVQIFDRDGRVLMAFGAPQHEPGAIVLPAKVAVDYDDLEWFRSYMSPGFAADYLIFVTSQFGSERLSVFAYGKDTSRRYPTDAELRREIEERREREREARKAE